MGATLVLTENAHQSVFLNFGRLTIKISAYTARSVAKELIPFAAL